MIVERLPTLQLWIGVLIMVSFSAYGTIQSSRSEKNAREASDAAAATLTKVTAENVKANLDKRICDISLPSWDTRKQLIIDTNEHTKLSPSLDPNSALGKALQQQLIQSNAQKDARKIRDLALNGPKPC